MSTKMKVSTWQRTRRSTLSNPVVVGESVRATPSLIICFLEDGSEQDGVQDPDGNPATTMDGAAARQSIHHDHAPRHESEPAPELSASGAAAPQSLFVEDNFIADKSSDSFSDILLTPEKQLSADQSAELAKNPFQENDQSIIAHLPDDSEWVECDDEQAETTRFFTLRWRIFIAMIAITLVAAFFYFLEKRRRKSSTSNGNVIGASEGDGGVVAEKGAGDVFCPGLGSPISMSGIDFVPIRDTPTTAGDRPAMVLTTPGGTDHMQSEFFVKIADKAAFWCPEVSGTVTIDDFDWREEIDNIDLVDYPKTVKNITPIDKANLSNRDDEHEGHLISGLEEIERSISIDRSEATDESELILEEAIVQKLTFGAPSSEAVKISVADNASESTDIVQCHQIIDKLHNGHRDHSVQVDQDNRTNSNQIDNGDRCDHIVRTNLNGDIYSDHPINGNHTAMVTAEYMEIYSNTAESIYAAAIGNDYDHITAEVRLTLPRPKQNQDHSEEAHRKIPAGLSPEPEVRLPTAATHEEPESSSLSEQPSLCEHTTAPEIETFEVSDLDLEQDECEEAETAPDQETKKNGSPPVILTQVTTIPPRPAHGFGIRRVKVEALDEHGRLVSINGNGVRANGAEWSPAESAGDEEEEEDARRSSVFDVIGARNMHEALIKMETLEAVTRVMRLAGLESSNLIFGIDYTASNKYQGEISFGGDSLHKISEDRLNPYQQVIKIMGQTLAPFAKIGCIPAFGFGDIRTSDTSIFPLKACGYCNSFDKVLEVYNVITPRVILSGPTNFAPLIYQAIDICKEFKCYQILVIVADGQVTNERATRRAIVAACRYPLSIIVVGVGDGPWDMMRIFDEKLPKRPWDNFHFVEFYKVTAGAKHPDLAFAVQSLLEIPDQYKQIKSLGLLNFD